jgi:hypothetical protein
MKLPEKDRQVLGMLRQTAKSNMAILAIEKRFKLLPRELRLSPKGRKLQRAFESRDALEDKVIAENPRATSTPTISVATSRRKRYAKALLALEQNATVRVSELESMAWRIEHPA